eukprot:TRINITY_DN13412_c0_g3_i2.p2 TRINITY_DN13412_c0_g3~~TRINITY_DN13412_c0_g3_i2.p2  ORF type:complete len:112 (+),score=22.82 TRINITY_DN13412_c0_g3_i2:122-457(+)
MIRRPPRSTLSSSSAASDVYKRQGINAEYGKTTPAAMGNLCAPEDEVSNPPSMATRDPLPIGGPAPKLALPANTPSKDAGSRQGGAWYDDPDRKPAATVQGDSICDYLGQK